MCLTLAGHVVRAEGDSALVDIDGHTLTVAARGMNDLLSGEAVLVGLGSILARLDETEAAAMTTDRALVERAGRPTEGGIR
jgi:hydrogenase maturation factor